MTPEMGAVPDPEDEVPGPPGMEPEPHLDPGGTEGETRPYKARKKRVRTEKAAAEELMESLLSDLGGLSLETQLFSRVGVATFGEATDTAVCVTPEYVVVLNQLEGRFEVRWFSEDDGITIVSSVPLENSHGFPLSQLPLIRYCSNTLGVCDPMGRIFLWDPRTGKLVYEVQCTVLSHEDGTELCAIEPAAFHVSETHVVVIRSDTESESTVMIRQWADVPMLGKYGKADTEWDRFQTRMSVPKFIATSPENPYEFFVCSNSGLGKINTLVPAPFRAVIPVLSWYIATIKNLPDYTEPHVDDIISAATAYVGSMETFASSKYRDRIETLMKECVIDPVASSLHTVSPPGSAAGQFVEEHTTKVMALRAVPLPEVPDVYTPDTVCVFGNNVVVTGTQRVMWTSIEHGAHCSISSAQGAIGSVMVPGGVVSATGHPALVHVKVPTSPGAKEESSSVDIRVDTAAAYESRPTMRPIIADDGTFEHRGAPPGTVIAVTRDGRIRCHLFSEHVWLFKLTHLDVPMEPMQTAMEAALADNSDDEDLRTGDVLERHKATIDAIAGGAPDVRTPAEVEAETKARYAPRSPEPSALDRLEMGYSAGSPDAAPAPDRMPSTYYGTVYPEEGEFSVFDAI